MLILRNYPKIIFREFFSRLQTTPVTTRYKTPCGVPSYSAGGRPTTWAGGGERWRRRGILMISTTGSRDKYSAALFNAYFQIWECKRSGKIDFLYCILAYPTQFGPLNFWQEEIQVYYPWLDILFIENAKQIKNMLMILLTTMTRWIREKLDILKESRKQMI